MAKRHKDNGPFRSMVWAVLALLAVLALYAWWSTREAEAAGRNGCLVQRTDGLYCCPMFGQGICQDASPHCVRVV